MTYRPASNPGEPLTRTAQSHQFSAFQAATPIGKIAAPNGGSSRVSQEQGRSLNVIRSLGKYAAALPNRYASLCSRPRFSLSTYRQISCPRRP
jgi:hypothetical protein